MLIYHGINTKRTCVNSISTKAPQNTSVTAPATEFLFDSQRSTVLKSPKFWIFILFDGNTVILFSLLCFQILQLTGYNDNVNG